MVPANKTIPVHVISLMQSHLKPDTDKNNITKMTPYLLYKGHDNLEQPQQVLLPQNIF